MASSPRVIGTLALSTCVMPVFDLRAEEQTMVGAKQASTFLLSVSMDHSTMGSTSIGLLMNATDSNIHVPSDVILKLSTTN